MKTRTLVSLFLLLLIAACGGQAKQDSESIVQTSVAGTTIAGQTATAALLGTAAAMQTVLAPSATDIFTATLPFTDTPLASDTPFPTDTLTPSLTPTVSSGGGATGCAVQCSGGGCHNIKINNKTNENAYLTLEGPGSYCFTVPPGVGYRYWILPGYYNITIEKCGGEVESFYHQLNSGWYFDIKC